MIKWVDYLPINLLSNNYTVKFLPNYEPIPNDAIEPRRRLKTLKNHVMVYLKLKLSYEDFTKLESFIQHQLAGGVKPFLIPLYISGTQVETVAFLSAPDINFKSVKNKWHCSLTLYCPPHLNGGN